MKILRLLGVASSVIVLSGAGFGLADDLIIETPTPFTVLGADEIEAYIGPGLSGFTAGIIVPEVTAGVRLRGVGNANVSLAVEGTYGYQMPGGVNEYWAGSRFGFQVDDINRVEVVASAGVGIIGAAPAYRFGIGTQIPVTPLTDLVIEGVTRGGFGAPPSDLGVRASVYFFPGRIGSDLNSYGAFEAPVVTDPLTAWAGGSVTVIPSASSAVPSVSGGLSYSFGYVDVGVRGELGIQVPANVYHVWAGGELGLPVAAKLRPYLYGDVGLLGGFPVNRVGLGLQHKVDTSLSLIGEFGGEGILGTITEFTAKGGIRYQFGAH